MDTWIPANISESEEFKLRALDLAQQFPSVFKVLPVDQSIPNWACYDFDGVVRIWIDSSHAEAIKLYQDTLHEKKEAIMTKELTVEEKKGVYGLLAQNFNALRSVLPESMKPEKVMRLGYQIVVKNPDLARKCSPASLINSILEAAALGLEVGGPLQLAHIIPYKGVAELRLDYKGLIELMHRSPLVSNIVVNAVYENDIFEYEYGSNQFLRHVPAAARKEGHVRLNKGKLVAAYCQVFFTNGSDKFVVCDQEMADNAKAHSDAKNSKYSPWNSPGDVHWMWIKTAVHRISKTIPKSPELQRAIAATERTVSVKEAKQDQIEYDHSIDVEFEKLAESMEPAQTNDVTPIQEAPKEDPAKDEPCEAPMVEDSKDGKPDPNLQHQYNLTRKKMWGEFCEACRELQIKPSVAHTPSEGAAILKKMNEMLS